MLVTLSLSVALIGCGTVSPVVADSPRQLHQPDVLRLPQGQAVQSTDGIHTPEVDEVWHSDRRYRELETELINAMAALAALQAKEATR